MGFEALGFPHRSRIRRVAVSMPARSLVVQFQVQTDPDPSMRLFARRFDEKRYHALVPHEEGHNIESMAPSPTTPHVYFNRFLWGYCDDSRGLNWDGLYRVDCESLAVECLLSRSTGGSASVSEILGISGDGASLYVVGGAGAPEANSRRIHYGVAELDLATLEMRPLTELRATFV
jgi:hypothetical protein